MFAGAFMYGVTHKHSYAEAGKLASLASSRVVNQWGPRLETQQAKRCYQILSLTEKNYDFIFFIYS